MFSRKKKKPENSETNINGEHEWAVVVLKPLREETRSVLSERLASVFSMSREEAANIVTNTPNILLDSLTKPVAVRIKDHFQSTGAEIFLTNDVLVKSKCFRTVWPEPPGLDFAETPSFDREPMAPALDLPLPERSAPVSSSPSMSIDMMISNKKVTDKAFTAPNKTSAQLQQEFDGWKQRYENWKASLEEIGDQAEKIVNQQETILTEIKEAKTQAESQSKEAVTRKALVADLDEKFEKLEELHAKLRELLTGRFEEVEKRLDEVREKTESLNLAVEKISSARGDIEKSIQAKEKAFEALKQDYSDIRTKLAEIDHLETLQASAWQNQLTQAEEKIQTLEESCRNLEDIIGAQREKYDALLQENQKLKSQSTLSKVNPEKHAGSDWKFREDKMSERLAMLEKLQLEVILDLQKRLKNETYWEAQSDRIQQGILELRKFQEELQDKLFDSSKRNQKKK